MIILKQPTKLPLIKQMAAGRFGNLAKAVVDIDKKIMAIDGELHADEEALLMQSGSKQKNLWGINLYPDKFGSVDFVEFDSLINLRPSQNNLSRGVDNPQIQKRTNQIVFNLINK